MPMSKPYIDSVSDTSKIPSKKMAVDVARRVFEGCEAMDAADVTHVIVVSCTGFYNPGPDYYIAQALDLSPGVERYCLGLMGCHAALPALKMATQFLPGRLRCGGAGGVRGTVQPAPAI